MIRSMKPHSPIKCQHSIQCAACVLYNHAACETAGLPGPGSTSHSDGHSDKCLNSLRIEIFIFIFTAGLHQVAASEGPLLAAGGQGRQGGQRPGRHQAHVLHHRRLGQVGSNSFLWKQKYFSAPKINNDPPRMRAGQVSPPFVPPDTDNFAREFTRQRPHLSQVSCDWSLGHSTHL